MIFTDQEGNGVDSGGRRRRMGATQRHKVLPVSQDSVAGGNVHTLVVTEAGEFKGAKLLLDPPKSSPHPPPFPSEGAST
jgi:hypothetical protein